MSSILSTTQSLCPACLKLIPANKIEDSGKVYLEKTCPEHGNFRVLIWRQNAQHYLDWAEGSERGSSPIQSYTGVNKGCPYDCGLCPEHQTRACTMVMEVTLNCDQNCPVCFASARKKPEQDLSIDVIRGMYRAVLDSVGICTIQLSGGEPTLRNDLPQIVFAGRESGFSHILVNTNGVRIAKDRAFLHSLKESGTSAIYLQFDGVSDDVYKYIRGKKMFAIKQKALDNCAAEGIGVILVPTIVPGINTHQIGDIIQFAKSRIPVVKGVHLQPVSYLGRYPHPPTDDDWFTIPDVIEALVAQTGGEVRREDIIPRHVRDSHCSFSSYFVLNEQGKLQSFTDLTGKTVNHSDLIVESVPEENSRRFMSDHWKLNESCCETCKCDNIYDQLLNYYLTITCMPFQDVWNIDLERLRACCGHLVTPNQKIVPFCAYYLTGIDGQRLYSPASPDKF